MAVPLISASFIQMAYSMTDMLWLGHLGSDAVAAAGAAGFFTWLCNALSFMTKIGAEITVSQSVGSKDYRRAAHYASQAITLSTTIGFIYACIIILAAPLLMGLFRFETSISTQAIDYMRLVAPGLFFQFNNNTFSGLYNGQGDSRTPFRTSAVGLIVNIILDPLLIYGIGPFPAWGTAGAAVATALAQLVVYGIFARRIFSDRFPLGRMHLLSRLKQDYARRIILLGLPVSIQNALFSMFSLTLATLAARWGAVGVAAQSIGAQIEAISWMTAAGFSTALAAFAGQNYGAGNLISQFLRLGDRARHTRQPIRQHDFRSEGFQQVTAFDAHCFGHGQYQMITFDGSYHCQPHPRIAAGRFYNSGAGLQRSARFGILNHCQPYAVFYTAKRLPR